MPTHQHDEPPDTFDDVRRATQLVRRDDYATYEEWHEAVLARLHPVNRLFVGGEAAARKRQSRA